MFETKLPHHTWTSSERRRGRRLHEVHKGCYVIEHVATGRFITGTSSRVSKDVDREIDRLRAGKHWSKLFNKVYEMDDECLIYEIPIDSQRQIKVELNTIERTASPPYLLIRK